MRNSFVIASLLVLTACQTTQPGSVAKGTCEIVHTPEYVVKGKAGYDQAWINRTTEALVDGCGQPRPKARPPELDAPVKAKAKPAMKPKSKLRLPWAKPKPPEIES